MPKNVTTPGVLSPATKKPKRQSGLAFWMGRVLEECDRARLDFAPDPVHDLRVALRRCRSMADGLMLMDPDKAWRAMKKAGKPLFQVLGDLRDAQVMIEELRRLGAADDPVSRALVDFATRREREFKQQAARALEEFDKERWNSWREELPGRAARIRPGTVVFKHMALERWTEAHELHRQALRSRSPVAFHRLRIGLKRFRYIVENFLPGLHQAWVDDLKQLQDLLGEAHDLDVLWVKAVELNLFPDEDSRARWQRMISQERAKRIEKYRQKMVGKQSLWNVWRAELPEGEQVRRAALSRLKIWASFLDPDFRHSRHVASLALRLYDGLIVAKLQASSGNPGARDILYAAALMHDAGRSRHEKGHHKTSGKLISQLDPPLGFTAQELKLGAAVARYHRGALPQPRHKSLAELPADQRKTALQLAAILRLANGFDSTRDRHIRDLELRLQNGFLLIRAQGYSPRDRLAENIAKARHLLELVYRRPVIVRRQLAAAQRPRGVTVHAARARKAA